MSKKIPTDDITAIGQRILRTVEDETVGDTLEAIESVKAYLTAKLMAPVERHVPPGERQRLH
jgi:hypothetical protein